MAHGMSWLGLFTILARTALLCVVVWCAPSSERVHKTSSSGQTLREAKHINTSLHFLEMVIINLSGKKKNSFVPYRNCRITQVLRDSLGGNCKTAMIATINPEPEFTDESISTCRFAQRVAQVKNSAIVNEETDPYLLIKRLKAEVASLKAEIAFLKGEQVRSAHMATQLPHARGPSFPVLQYMAPAVLCDWRGCRGFGTCRLPPGDALSCRCACSLPAGGWG